VSAVRDGHATCSTHIVKNCGSCSSSASLRFWLIDRICFIPVRVTANSPREPMPIYRESAIGVCVLDGA